MQATLYATTGDISLKKSFNTSLCAKNKLNLLPEHLAQISTAFILQLSLAGLTSRDLRILSAIYSQTIGYDKREDDMNGARLEQLTAIRHDHANESVRSLEGLNIIITRQGHYGKWMSINFDFLNWGEAQSESTTNDPRCLLPPVYQNIPSNDTVEFHLHALPDNKEKESTQMIKAENKAVQPSANLPSESTAAPVKPSLTAATDKGTPPKRLEQLAFKLNFPDSFSDKLRHLISTHLASFKIPQQAQRLLDYFAKCLLNGKIRNPIGYFINLKNRCLTGGLDLDNDQQPLSSPAVSEKKSPQRKKIEQRIAYQDAVADIDQLKKIIKTVCHEEQCTFQEALKKIHYTAIWEKAIDCLEQTKKPFSRLI